MSIAWPQKPATHRLIGNRKLFIALEETKLCAIRLLRVDLVQNPVTNGRDLKREGARRLIEQLFNRELNRRGSQGVQKLLQVQRLKALEHPDLPNPATILLQHMAEAPSMVFMRMRQTYKCERLGTQFVFQKTKHRVDRQPGLPLGDRELGTEAVDQPNAAIRELQDNGLPKTPAENNPF